MSEDHRRVWTWNGNPSPLQPTTSFPSGHGHGWVADPPNYMPPTAVIPFFFIPNYSSYYSPPIFWTGAAPNPCLWPPLKEGAQPDDIIMQDAFDMADDVSVNSDFCIQIANRISLEEISKGSNCVCSPISIHACLSLVATGSTGKTLEQFLLYLKSTTVDDLNDQSSQVVKLMSPHGNRGGPVLSFANSIWIDKRFLLKRQFQEIASSAHVAEVKNVDFLNKADQAKDEINSWVERATSGLIKDIVRSLDNFTRIVLANALYFKGAWTEEFKQCHTRDRKFHLLNGDTIQVPFMSKWGTHPIRDFNEFKVVKLPYRNGIEDRNFSMYIFLPEEKNGLKNLIEKVNLNIGFFSQDFMLQEVELGDLAIPRFKALFDFEASAIVRELGLTLPFAGGLSNMLDSAEDLSISSIIHKACVEVNEEGTTAAAATVVVGYGSPPKPTFVADHPFMFIIREETSGMVLFTGTVLDPAADP